MKTNKNVLYIARNVLFAIVLLVLSACTNNFEEINTPPTSSTFIDPGFMLTNVQRSVAFMECAETPNNVFGSWVQHWCGGPLFTPSRYVPEEFAYVWNDYYGILKNLGLIKNDLLVGLENDPAGRTKLAIAKILEIYVWQNLTDMFGPVPYTESELPSAEIIRQPKFDTQESIYKSLISDLDIAMSQLNSGDESYGTADLYYKGDVERWNKFGNSLKIRLGMRIKYVDAALAKSTVESALSKPLINSNEENADVQTYDDFSSSRHPILRVSQGGSPDYFFLAEKLVDVLIATNDPRLPLLGDTTKATAGTPNAEFKGVKVAQTDDYYSSIIRTHFSQISSLTYYNKNRSIPIHTFSYAEVCFFKAEAALDGWGGFSDANAETFFQEGIQAAMSMKPYNIDKAVIPVEYIASEFSLSGLSKEKKLEKIMTQKWILLFGRNFEAWTEWRRTGYPVLIPGPDGEGIIPRRLIFPVMEAALNSENYKAAVSTLSNGDVYQSKVWWDRK